MGNSLNNTSKIQKVVSEKPEGQMPVNDTATKAHPPRAHEPGEGIRSMKTSSVFRALNFELYAKPNKPTMIIGGVAIVLCAGYIVYMNVTYDYDRAKFYSAEAADGSLILRPKKSRWES